MHPSTLVSVRIKSDVAIRLENLARSMDHSKSYLAAEAIEEYLDIHEWQLDAINLGIHAADKGEVLSLEEVKRHLEQEIEDSPH